MTTKILLLSLLLGLSLPTFGKIFNGLDLRSNQESKLETKDKYIVYYFLNNDCPCSQNHFDYLNSLSKKNANLFQFVGFNSNKNTSIKRAHKYYKKFKIDFPVFLDKSLEVANELKALKTPHVFVTNPKGEVVYQGGATNSRNPKKASKFYLENILTHISKGKELPYKYAKTLGCYIQR